MRRIIPEIEFMIIDAFIYISALVLAFLFIRSESIHIDIVSESVNSKINVCELDDKYKDKDYIVSSASILYDVLACKKGTIINIDGYQLTEEDFNKIRNEGNNQPLLSHIQPNHDYIRNYLTDSNGKINGIKYKVDY